MNIYKRKPVIVDLIAQGIEPDLNQRSAEEVVSFWTDGLLDLEKNKDNHLYAAKYALDNGFRLSLQTHLYAGVA